MSLVENQAICSGCGAHQASDGAKLRLCSVCRSARYCPRGWPVSGAAICMPAVSFKSSTPSHLACQVLLPGLPKRPLEGAQAAMQGGRCGPSSSCWTAGCRGGSAGGCRGPQGEGGVGCCCGNQRALSGRQRGRQGRRRRRGQRTRQLHARQRGGQRGEPGSCVAFAVAISIADQTSMPVSVITGRSGVRGG